MIHNIIPLAQVGRQAINDMAKAAADRGDALELANVFEPGSDQHRDFQRAYLRREAALELVG